MGLQNNTENQKQPKQKKRKVSFLADRRRKRYAITEQNITTKTITRKEMTAHSAVASRA